MKPTSKIVIFVLAILTSMVSAHAQSPREQLSQMVEQLQKTPTDNALREKIIKLTREVKPTPAVPPEAKRAFVMGGTYQKEAKTPEDFALAVKSFQEATTAAPWWGDAYYNLSVALESAKRYDEAKGALTLYLLTQPKDAEQAQERLYAIDAKKVLAAKQQADATRAAIAAEERKKNSIEGCWFDGGSPIFMIERVGEALVLKSTEKSLAFSAVQTTETSVSFTLTLTFIGNSARQNFELRGSDLVEISNGFRYVRKPCPAQ